VEITFCSPAIIGGGLGLGVAESIASLAKNDWRDDTGIPSIPSITINLTPAISNPRAALSALFFASIIACLIRSFLTSSDFLSDKMNDMLLTSLAPACTAVSIHCDTFKRLVESVKRALLDKRQSLKLALYSLLESWRADPTKFNSLIHFVSSPSVISKSTIMNYPDSGCYHASFSSYYNQNSYTENLIEIIVNGTYSFYDKMVEDFTNETIANAAASTNSNLLLPTTHLDEQTGHIQALVYRHITKPSIYDNAFASDIHNNRDDY
jgi:hypothetical protein